MTGFVTLAGLLCLYMSVPGLAGPVSAPLGEHWEVTDRNGWPARSSGDFLAIQLDVNWRRNIKAWGRDYNTQFGRFNQYAVSFRARKGGVRYQCFGYAHWPPPSPIHMDYQGPPNQNQCWVLKKNTISHGIP